MSSEVIGEAGEAAVNQTDISILCDAGVPKKKEEKVVFHDWPQGW